MNRRDFLSTGLAAGAALSAGSLDARAEDTAAKTGKGRFQLKYAPHFGMFRHLAGDDLVDQVKFMADQGFTALEDNGMRRRPVELQEQIAREMTRLGMTMGVFVATADFGNPTFASGKADFADKVLEDIRDSVEVAKRVNAKWVTVVPGKFDHRLPMGYQTANVVDLLRRCAEICEAASLVMVLEPLNHWANHPELFLHQIPQAFQICRAVDSPSCKILFDIYHQQITEGNLIPNIDQAWNEVAYFQIGDNPGRKEPGTGEIHYRNIFRHIHEKGFKGVLGMEHGNSKPGADGEQAVIDAYVAHDQF
ncbi:MAG: TIM barrel protein [Planctomycetaceae bacterium]|nr:TIM barrel protein [Planctomycetaceae bacterium]